MEWKISTEPVNYPDALDFMAQRVEAIARGEAVDCAWLLEHPPLYTAGTSAKSGDLLEPSKFPVYETGRGGEYTYHGPGQRIGYVMMDLHRWQSKPDIKAYVWALEEWIIRTLDAFDIKGERRCGRIGIWVVMPNGAEKKIAAIGVRIRRWVTLHGIALNVAPDLSHFGGIVPCGLSDFGVTSLADLGVNVTMNAVDQALQESFAGAFSQNTARCGLIET
ncbi:MAG: lipoyl(octanoyl) transferase LipB [Alphaproteobacteria bacterium]